MSPRNHKSSLLQCTAPLAAGFLLAVAAGASATTYYVNGATGSDANPGTSAQPFATIGRIYSSLNPGDTLRIAGNCTYAAAGLVLSNKTGTASAPIVIDAYNTNGDPAQRPVIQGPNNPVVSGSTPGLALSHCSYVTIRNLSLLDQAAAGVEVDSCSNVTVEFCQTQYTGSSGVRSTNSSNVTVRYNTVQYAVQGGYNECITLDGVSGFSVYGNYVGLRNTNPPTGDGGEGIDTKDGSQNGAVYENIIDQICRMNIYVDGWDKNCGNIDVYGNICQNGGGDGLVTAMENGNSTVTLSNVRIFNNVCSGTKSGVYFNGGGGGSAHQLNNTQVYHNSADNVSNGLYLSNHQAVNTTMKYNALGANCTNSVYLMANTNNPTASQVPAGLQCFNNVCFKGWVATYGGSNIFKDPKFTGVGGIPTQFLLQSTSPAISVDTDASGSGASFVTRDFRTQLRDASRDAGAYEYVGNATLKFEAEQLTVQNYWTQSGGAVRNIGPDSNLSNSDGIIIDSANTNDQVTFLLPAVPAGNYTVYVGQKNFPSRGIYQLSAAALGSTSYSNIGAPVDEYAASANYTVVNLGTWSPGSTSDKLFKFTVTGKNANSSGTSYNYAVAIDYIQLVPQ